MNNKHAYRFLTLCVAALATVAGSMRAQTLTPFQEIAADVALSANNYLAYRGPQQVLTPAPAGYQPVYISHYGRHGSRYLIDPDDYGYPIRVLSQARRDGMLTDLGTQTLLNILKMRHEADGRLGELTPLGAEQHRQIARRMIARFPEVFRDSAHVDARSTVVIRCILSMENALQELLRHNPRLRISHDASQHDMYYMNQQDTILFKQKMNPATKRAYEQWENEHVRPQRLMKALFTSDVYIRENINSRELYYKLYHLAGIVQNSEIRHTLSLYPLFTTSELCQLWEQENIWWYLTYGPNTLNGGHQPYTQRNLLRNIIHEADSCLALRQPCATLRYGHETMVMPLASLLALNGLDRPAGSLDKVAQQWVDYRIFPMGANIQLVFYRKTETPLCSYSQNIIDNAILVKVLLNEDEATLPLPDYCGNTGSSRSPYYRWDDVRQYYLNKLDDWERLKEADDAEASRQAAPAHNAHGTQTNTSQPNGTQTNTSQSNSLQPATVGMAPRDTKVYVDVSEEMPSFPGGPSAMMSWLSENKRYPEAARQQGITGRVVVAFIVEADGTLSDLRVSRPVDPLLDEEAVRLVRNMPRWKPGRIGGKPVRCRMTLPIAFRDNH